MKTAWARGLLGGVLCVAAMSGYLAHANAQRDTSSRFYLYGHWLTSDFDRLQAEVAPYNIKLVPRSCIVGGEEFDREMLLNKAIYESVPVELGDKLRSVSVFR